ATPVDIHVNQTAQKDKAAVKIAWQSVSDYKDHIDVYRATDENGPYSRLNTGALDQDTTNYVDTTVDVGKGYYYYLVATNEYGTSQPSDTSHVVISLPLPAAPVNVQASQSIYNNKRAIQIVCELGSDNTDHIEIYRAK